MQVILVALTLYEYYYVMMALREISRVTYTAYGILFHLKKRIFKRDPKILYSDEWHVI